LEVAKSYATNTLLEISVGFSIVTGTT